MSHRTAPFLLRYTTPRTAPNWTEDRNWRSDEPLGDWHGVTTDSEGRVTSLFLASNQMTGTIPASLGNLSSLRSLFLHSNQLTGSIPTSLGNLSRLRVLILESNQFSGTIPSELGNLSNLQRLLLGSNQLTGTIPATLGQSGRPYNNCSLRTISSQGRSLKN